MSALPSRPARKPSRPKTCASDLRERLEEDIATGVLPPDTHLDEAQLAARFGVSRTPVREALIQLASAGIIEMRPHRGAIVPILNPQRLVEMFEVMSGLEAMCGRLAARRMSAAERDSLDVAHRRCEAALNAGDPDAYYRENEVFHSLIYEGSHNNFLAEQVERLRRRLLPYRRLQLRVRDRVRASFSEHQRVLDAILQQDPDLAAEALRKHVLVQGDRFSDLMAVVVEAMGGAREGTHSSLDHPAK